MGFPNNLADRFLQKVTFQSRFYVRFPGHENKNNNNQNPLKQSSPVTDSFSLSLTLETKDKHKNTKQEKKIEKSNYLFNEFDRYGEWIFVQNPRLFLSLDLDEIDDEEEISVTCGFEDLNRSYQAGLA